MSSATPAVTGSGHDRAVWRARIASSRVVSLPELRRLVPERDRLVVFSAHPDDESIGAGRLLSAWRRSGGHARAVLATAGEACVDHVGTRPVDLPARRLREWEDALAVLDVEPGETYGLPDGGLEQAADALEVAVTRTLTRERADRCTASGAPPDAPSHGIVLLAPHPSDPHPDHRAVGRAVGRVAARLQVPVWSFGVWLTYWSDPGTDLDGELVTVAVEERDDQAWDEAVRCFHTQLTPLAPGWGAVVPPGMLAHHDRQLLVLPSGHR